MTFQSCQNLFKPLRTLCGHLSVRKVKTIGAIFGKKKPALRRKNRSADRRHDYIKRSRVNITKGCEKMAKKKRLEKKVTIDGKRISVYGFSAFEIEKKIEALKTEAELKKCPTFSMAMDEWFEDHRQTIKYNTAACYQAPIRDVRAEFGDLRVSQITPFDIQSYLNAYAKLGYKRQTVFNRLAVIRQVFAHCILCGFVSSNPASAVKMPPTAKNGVRQLPAEEDVATVKRVVKDGFELLPYLILYTGLRRGEALALTWEDVDFTLNRVNVDKTVVFEGVRPVVRAGTKTQSGVRVVPLLEPLKKVLISIPKRSGFIFSLDGGKSPYTQSDFKRLMRYYTLDYNVSFTLHQLRHEYATICYDAGLTAKDAQKLLGHSNEAVTMDIYTHIRKSRQEEAAEKLNSFVTDAS